MIDSESSNSDLEGLSDLDATDLKRMEEMLEQSQKEEADDIRDDSLLDEDLADVLLDDS